MKKLPLYTIDDPLTPQMPVPFEPKGHPSRWVTWQAWYVLKATGVDSPKNVIGNK